MSVSDMAALLRRWAGWAVVPALVVLGGCVPLTATMPPGSVTLASFTTPYGLPGVVVQAPQAGDYSLIFPGSTDAPVRIARLVGIQGARLAGQMATGGENVLLFEGSDQSCPVRDVLLAVRYPQLRTFVCPVCGQSFGLGV